MDGMREEVLIKSEFYNGPAVIHITVKWVCSSACVILVAPLALLNVQFCIVTVDNSHP